MFGNLDEMKNRIDRVIEYIEDNCIHQQWKIKENCHCLNCLYISEMRNLISILKGESH